MNINPLPVQIVSQHMLRPNLDVYYPVVIGHPNPTVQQIINNTIHYWVNSQIKQQGYYQNPQTQVTGTFELKTNERNILSLNLINYGYPPLAAHGMTYIKSLTFNVKTGKVYSLADLFKPGSDYITPISDNIKIQIKQRDIMTLEEFNQIKPDQDYYIADKALVVYFQLYELTAYAYGFPMFPISVFDLQSIAREKGPIDIMATND